MKHLFRFLGLSLAASALFLTACSKKPVHGALPPAEPMGNGINPDSVAIAPDTTLEARTTTADDLANANRSVVEPIYFPLDRAAVPPSERPKLDAAVKWLKEHPDQNIVLEGHCDWRGTAEYNLGLGDRRANAVKRYLETLGVNTQRLETLSKGSQDAKQTGGESEWAKDRRVDFLVLKKQQ